MTTAAIVLLQVLLMVALAPLWNGVVAALKARLQMRHGPPVLQRYRDLFKLAGKETVLSEHASPLARVAPYVVLGAAVTLCTWTPVLTTQPGLAFAGGVLYLVHVSLAALLPPNGRAIPSLQEARSRTLSAFRRAAVARAAGLASASSTARASTGGE